MIREKHGDEDHELHKIRNQESLLTKIARHSTQNYGIVSVTT